MCQVLQGKEHGRLVRTSASCSHAHSVSGAHWKCVCLLLLPHRAGREAELEEALQKLERGSVPGLRERDRRSLLRKLAAEQERGVDSSDEEDGSAAVVGLGERW